ncbi:hypothetical protein [Halapricum hydrolyticum]|uniref:Rubrerythrin-like domain-containing protein n=1 Tax=Halapricum hydrolyticum TaxID=2979991 RepID=A0AAE3ICS5_9EURY|nr:hypothetical protein [Halapricum hydrolyticum]MCU4718638.1 hypothetical protein [Halapricum hydrolyticum]MCU4727676.1 hypothetical protein [Halapricum hydrolyticum]
MTLGTDVSQAMNKTREDDPELLVYECEGCGRPFARERESCPACDGDVTKVVLY